MSLSTLVSQPPLKPIVGNLTEMQGGTPVQNLMRLARTCGPFFKLKILGNEFYVASSQELVNELCDESRFNKRVQRRQGRRRRAEEAFPDASDQNL